MATVPVASGPAKRELARGYADNVATQSERSETK